MAYDKLKKFQVDIWFEQLPDYVKLGAVHVYASTEAEAIELAKNHTEYEISGVDGVTWQVREPAAIYY